MIFAVGLQDDGDDGHDGFDDAELQSRLENTLQFRRQTRQQSVCAPKSEMTCVFVCNKIKQGARGGKTCMQRLPGGWESFVLCTKAWTKRLDNGGRKVPPVQPRSAPTEQECSVWSSGGELFQMALPNWFTLRYLAFGGGKPLRLPTCHSGYSYKEENLLMRLYTPDVWVTKLKNPPVSLFTRIDWYINGIYYWIYSFYTIRCIRGGWRAEVGKVVSAFYAFHAQFGEYELDPSHPGFGTLWPPSVTFCPTLNPFLHLPLTLTHPLCSKTAVSAVQTGLHYQNYKSVFLLK